MVVVFAPPAREGRYVEGMTEADKLRARWKIAQPILDELDRRDSDAYLCLPITERLLRTIRLGEESIRWHPEHLFTPDDEHLTWARVHDVLQGHAQ